MEQIKDSLESAVKRIKKDKLYYISREFQDFGVRLAEELNDLKHKSLYIKLSKEKPRVLLLKALEYVSDYPSAKKKGALFMWKLKQLTKENK